MRKLANANGLRISIRVTKFLARAGGVVNLQNYSLI